MKFLLVTNTLYMKHFLWLNWQHFIIIFLFYFFTLHFLPDFDFFRLVCMLFSCHVSGQFHQK